MPPPPPAGLRVLIVEDDADIRESTGMLLRRHGYDVRLADGGRAGLEQVLTDPPDIAIVDIAMPDLDGITLTRRIKESGDLPVILLTARDLPSDVVHGLDAGADDYVTKPYDATVLLARMRAVARRRGGTDPTDDVERFDGIVVDRAARRVTRGEEAISLTSTEFRLLEALLDNAGIVLSRAQALRRVWGDEEWAEERVVDTNIQRLRAKLRTDAIQTVRGFGYRLDAP
ncbi:response regulator transcription factor [Nocardioides rotundus]|uniref:response regulator transcription factor n=1 Tax=Nocardioides rotundus TaxID=1774216 RepID=UPI001CC029A9|nr:response regulator transcription factor [Nocardioides rotundus]